MRVTLTHKKMHESFIKQISKMLALYCLIQQSYEKKFNKPKKYFLIQQIIILLKICFGRFRKWLLTYSNNKSLPQPELLIIDSQGTLMINIKIQRSNLRLKNQIRKKEDSWELWQRPACKKFQLNLVTWKQIMNTLFINLQNGL